VAHSNKVQKKVYVPELEYRLQYCLQNARIVFNTDRVCQHSSRGFSNAAMIIQYNMYFS
jgi:hypothetical protein